MIAERIERRQRDRRPRRWWHWRSVRKFVVPWPFVPLHEHMDALAIGLLIALTTFLPLLPGQLLDLNAPVTRSFDRDESVFVIFDSYQHPLLGYALAFVLTYGLLAILLRTATIQRARQRDEHRRVSYRGPALAAAAWLALLASVFVLPVGS